MTLSELIRGRRTALDLTQAAVAEAVGCERSFIALIETAGAVPSAQVLDRLCDTLRLTPEERSEALRLAAEAARARQARAEPPHVLTPLDEVADQNQTVSLG